MIVGFGKKEEINPFSFHEKEEQEKGTEEEETENLDSFLMNRVIHNREETLIIHQKRNTLRKSIWKMTNL